MGPLLENGDPNTDQHLTKSDVAEYGEVEDTATTDGQIPWRPGAGHHGWDVHRGRNVGQRRDSGEGDRWSLRDVMRGPALVTPLVARFLGVLASVAPLLPTWLQLFLLRRPVLAVMPSPLDLPAPTCVRQPLRIHIPHRRGIHVAVEIDSTLIPDRVASEPAAVARRVIPIPHIIIFCFGVVPVAAVFKIKFTTGAQFFALAFSG